MSDDSPSLRLPLDLNDPVVENEVADAIRRLAPEGAYVPLSQRYPWRFSEPTAGAQDATLVDAVVAALIGSADVHEAERIPHLVGPLRELAVQLERGALVPGPPPGRCPALSPETHRGDDERFRYSCELRATHAGLHEATTYDSEPGILGPAGKMTWADVALPADPRLEQIAAALGELRGTVTEPVPYAVAMVLERIAGIVEPTP